jgi:hypothetical protein
MDTQLLWWLLAVMLGALMAVFGFGMARGMGGAVASSASGAVVGTVAGAVHAIRLGIPSLGMFWMIAAVGGLLGCAAAYLTTLRKPRSVIASGFLFGLLGGGLVGIAGGAVVGGASAIELLRRRPAERGR